METLWSPWRMAYISGTPAPDRGGGTGGGAAEDGQEPDAAAGATPEAAGCIFCTKPAAGPGHDRANLLLWRGEHAFVILNLYPYNSAHLMVVPYRHLHDVTRLTAAECAEIMALFQRMVAALAAEYGPQGFNAGMNLGEVAGAGIADHLHLHVVPRWAGDTNFMPVVGQTKVLPEALEQTYDRLRRRLLRAEG
ncbi:MAG: HIT domain-containing protein [Chloroflexota bacterium]|nr:HIT domain-containing protein [Chloroflexota bacterium]